MTTVAITAVTNTVTVTENGSSTVVTVPQTSTVTAITQGPQGAQGAQGIQGLQGASGIIVDDTAKIDKSVVYYDASAATFKADTIYTVPTLTDGGNF